VNSVIFTLANGAERNPNLSGELQQDQIAGRSLDWYDYGARMYDPGLGRWHSVDPVVENKEDKTLYGAFFNNPIRVIDPDGQIEYDVVNGQLVYSSPLGGSNMFIYNHIDGEFAGRTLSVHMKEDGLVTSWYDTPSNYLEKVFSHENAVGWTDYFNSGAWQYHIPVWGASKRAGEALNEGRYLESLGYATVGFIELASLRPVMNSTVARSGCATTTKQSTKVTAAKASTNVARTLGVQGERAVGTMGSKTRIPSLTGTAKYRIPDKLTSTTLTEVKNVNSLSLTRQLRDFHMYSTQNGLQFHLYTRPTTTFSGPLQNLINQGSIIVKPIPGL